MTGENPMYSESKIIRAAIRFFGAVSEDVRRDIIIASLNREDVRPVMRRHGICVPTEMDEHRSNESQLYSWSTRSDL